MTCPRCSRVVGRRDEVADGRRRCVHCHIEFDADSQVFDDTETWPWLVLATWMDRSMTTVGVEMATHAARRADRRQGRTLEVRR